MFAFTNPAVPGDVAADILVGLPAEELFLTNSSVEIYRLIHAPWGEFRTEKQQQILRRICDGPPRTMFREGADIGRNIDRSRYDFLSSMVGDGVDIGPEAEKLLAAIHERWPQWQPKPAEQAGFHIWHEGGFRDRGGGADKLKDVPDDELVAQHG